MLFYKNMVIDEAGRRIYGTALQMALGAKDVAIGRHEEMAEMISRYLKQLPEGPDEIRKQYAQQFPEGYEIRAEERKEADLITLKKIFGVIANAKTGEECDLAIKEFHDHLKKQKYKI